MKQMTGKRGICIPFDSGTEIDKAYLKKLEELI